MYKRVLLLSVLACACIGGRLEEPSRRVRRSPHNDGNSELGNARRSTSKGHGPMKAFAALLLKSDYRVAFSPLATGMRLPAGSPTLPIVSKRGARFEDGFPVMIFGRRPPPPPESPGVLVLLGGALQGCTKAINAAVTARPIASLAATFIAGCAVGCVVTPSIQNAMAIYSTAEDIPAKWFRQQQTLTARVIKVTDGDTYRVAHIPLFSRWRRSDAKKSKAEGGKAKLSESTLSIRIAAVDTPETAKFGSKGQAFGDEATDFVKKTLEGRVVRVKLLSRDQYQRAVATVSYREGLQRHDISEELLKRGLAAVYRQGGGQYDGSIDRWDRIEAQAKKKKVGIWSKKGGVDMAAYKREQKAKK